MRAAITLAIMIRWIVPAHADNEVGVVAIGDGNQLPLIAAHVTEWLNSHGRVVVTTPISPDAITEMVDCFALDRPSCGRNVVDAQAKASTIVIVRVAETQGATRDIALTAYWFDKGHPAIAETGTCERCTNASLSSTTDAIMTKLTRAVASAIGHVKFRSSPPGARITVDDKTVGVTPLDWDLPAGKHAIRMRLDKHEPQQRSVTVRADWTEVVEMSLGTAAGHPRGANADSGVRRGFPMIAMGAGAAALVAGGVMIAIDQNEDRRAPVTVHNSAPVGAAISIAGVAIAGVGVYLWLRRPATSSSPVAAVAGDSAYIGWSGRF